MKAVKKILLILGSLAGFTALILQFYNPFRADTWRLERTRENKLATVRIVNVTRIATGSGVVISSSGSVLTAAHVALPGETIFVIFYDSKGIMHLKLATVGIWDKESQLAILFTRGELPPPVTFGRSRDVREGDLVYTVGYPGSMKRPMVDAGIVAQRHYTPPQPKNYPRNSILATIHPVFGMSGSPIFNSRGELIGIFDAMTGEYTMGGPRLWGVVSPTDSLTRILKKWFATSGMPTPTARM